MLRSRFALRVTGTLSLLLAGFAGACGDDPPAEPMMPAGSSADAGPPPTPGCADDCGACLEPAADGDRTALLAAFGQAQAGQPVCLGPGMFSFDDAIDVPVGVELRGSGRASTRLDFASQGAHPYSIALSDDATLAELTVFESSASTPVLVGDVDRARVRGVSVLFRDDTTSSPTHGILVEGAQQVSIVDSEACCARRSAIGVTMSARVAVRGSQAYASDVGVSVENASDVELEDNHVHDNAIGILVANVPQSPLIGTARVKVTGNVIENNDHETSFAGADVLTAVPAGVGVLVLAADEGEVVDNQIRGHGTAGVLLATYLEVLFGAFNAPLFDELPERNWVHDNVFTGNGGNPRFPSVNIFPELATGPDIGWDGCLPAGNTAADATRANCVSGNDAARYLDMRLVVCGGDGMSTAELGAAACERTPLPALGL